MRLDPNRWVRFSGFRRVGRAATGARIGLIDVILSDLGQPRSLGSFGCGVFVRGALRERLSFRALVVNETHSDIGKRIADGGTVGELTLRAND